jgi:hypothetical protein
MKDISWATKFAWSYHMVEVEPQNMLVILVHASSAVNWAIGPGNVQITMWFKVVVVAGTADLVTP